MKLKPFLQTMSLVERKAFAEACKTGASHLHNISYEYRPCSPELAIEIERQSNGAVSCEEVCPEFDWAYTRARAKRQPNRSAA
jgi:DNA-binding transcriptional regulator YdaS (Cro superfamily)